MPLGEVLGVRWDNVDGEAADLHVRCSLSRPVGGSPHLVEPKTGSSARRIGPDAQTMEAPRGYRRRQAADRLRAGQRWGDRGLVFATRTGGFARPQDVRESFNTEIRQSGLVRIRFHDPRHTPATLLLRQGRTIQAVADRPGHANAANLLRRHPHVLPDQRAGIARVVGDVLGGGDHR